MEKTEMHESFYLWNEMLHRRYYTPNEVARHSNRERGCWVSVFGRVFDVTPLIKTTAERNDDLSDACTRTLLTNGGRDVSHWFDKETGDVRRAVDEHSGLLAPYTPSGAIPHVVPSAPTTGCPIDFETPWWHDDAHCIGSLSAHTRRVEVLNVLTQQRHIVECAAEETLAEVCERYAEEANAHARSYTWKYLGRVLNTAKTLAENGIPDDENEFLAAGVDGRPFIPTLFVHFNDDLTC